MDLWNAEDGHDCVTDEFLYRATMTLDRGTHLAEIPKHELAHGLGIDPLAQRSRAHHVAKEQRRELPTFGVGRTQRTAAHAAEPEAVWILLAALPAALHDCILWLAGNRLGLPRMSTQGGSNGIPDRR
jgi:hypothetical protein